MKRLTSVRRKLIICWYKSWKRADIRWRKFKKWRFWEVFSVLFLITALIVILIFFNSLSSILFPTENSRGELVKVILSVFGGLGLFYGLWINSQRIKAQNKQNKIAEDRNQDQKSYDADKRFGEAIGYLGTDNTSIVLGGIYSLYQLAKEDKRYKPIVAGIFTSYIKEKSDELYSKMERSIIEKKKPETPIKRKPPIEIETIINLLFNNNNVFAGEFLDLSYSTFKNVRFSGDVINCSFECSCFDSCDFNGNLSNTDFNYSRIKDTRFGTNISIIENCQFWASKLDSVQFYGTMNSNLDFSLSTILVCRYSPNNLENCSFIMSNIDEKTIFSNINTFNNTHFKKDQVEKIQFEACVEDYSIFP